MLPWGHIIARKSEVIYVMLVQFPLTNLRQTHCDGVIIDKKETVPS